MLEDLKMPTLDEVHVIGKGRRERILPLWKETRSDLRDWLAIRPKSADRHLFRNAMGTGLTRRGFAKRLVLHVQTATHGVPSITGKTVSPLLLRHTCAIHTLRIHFTSACPDAALLRMLAGRLAASGP